MSIFIDGDFNMVDGQKALLAKIDALDTNVDNKTALKDRVKYHAPEGVPYASTIGMPMFDDDDNYIGSACIGCWWCEGIGTNEDWDEQKRLVIELALDDPATYGLTKAS